MAASQEQIVNQISTFLAQPGYTNGLSDLSLAHFVLRASEAFATGSLSIAEDNTRALQVLLGDAITRSTLVLATEVNAYRHILSGLRNDPRLIMQRVIEGMGAKGVNINLPADFWENMDSAARQAQQDAQDLLNNNGWAEGASSGSADDTETKATLLDKAIKVKESHNDWIKKHSTAGLFVGSLETVAGALLTYNRGKKLVNMLKGTNPDNEYGDLKAEKPSLAAKVWMAAQTLASAGLTVLGLYTANVAWQGRGTSPSVAG